MVARARLGASLCVLLCAFTNCTFFYVSVSDGKKRYCGANDNLLSVDIFLLASHWLFFYCLHRAPVRGTLPFTVQCLHRQTSRTMMTIVLNLGRYHRHPGTRYRGTYPDMNVQSGKFREAPCWIRQRERCSGLQVSVWPEFHWAGVSITCTSV